MLLVVGLGGPRVASKHALESSAGPAFMEYSSRSLCCATANGHVYLLDKHTLRHTHTLCEPTATSFVMSMDVMSNTLVTCGMTFSNYQQAAVNDPFIKCYDLRANKALQPITSTPAAALVSCVPAVGKRSFSLQILTAGVDFSQICSFAIPFERAASCN